MSRILPIVLSLFILSCSSYSDQELHDSYYSYVFRKTSLDAFKEKREIQRLKGIIEKTGRKPDQVEIINRLDSIFLIYKKISDSIGVWANDTDSEIINNSLKPSVLRNHMKLPKASCKNLKTITSEYLASINNFTAGNYENPFLKYEPFLEQLLPAPLLLETLVNLQTELALLLKPAINNTLVEIEPMGGDMPFVIQAFVIPEKDTLDFEELYNVEFHTALIPLQLSDIIRGSVNGIPFQMKGNEIARVELTASADTFDSTGLGKQKIEGILTLTKHSKILEIPIKRTIKVEQ